MIEAGGLEGTVGAAVEAVGRGGTMAILENVAPQVAIPLQRIVAGEIRLQGGCPICNEYAAALTLLERDAVGAESLVSTRAGVFEAPTLLERLHAGDPNAPR